MMNQTLSTALLLLACIPASLAQTLDGETVGVLPEQPFGEEYPLLDVTATGEWWNNLAKLPERQQAFVAAVGLTEERPQSIAFAIYSTESAVLKLSAQLYPQRPEAPTRVRLEFFEDGKWVERATSPIHYPGWSAHFRIEEWDMSRDVLYRVRHASDGVFEGKIRRDPVNKDRVTIAVMSCNGTHDVNGQPHTQTVANLRKADPDMLFFAGDQHYQHTQHTAGWIAFGTAFADILRDRPTVTIPDDHDVGHPNLWGESGGKSNHGGGADGGYFFPPAYVNLVQRQQCWHLPDAFDPTPLESGISVYYTRMRVGGVDFAILEDRKFKTGPLGTIPKMGPRPDHINDPAYDPASIDLEGLELLGERQMHFLKTWSQDWSGAHVKAALSQTAFCGAVHIHGRPDNYLLADLDCNGWPQRGRNEALRVLRSVRAAHMCGDQHLAVLVKHGIDEAHEGPFGFTSPALYNSIYGRWWKPADGKAGEDPIADSPLEFTGNFRDGLGNPIRMIAYANPSFEPKRKLEERADGFGLAHFDKASETITFECWSRFADIESDEQFAGWPVTVSVADNDSRTPTGWMATLEFDAKDPVVQLRSVDGEVVYTRRVRGKSFDPPAFGEGEFEVWAGVDAPTRRVFVGTPGKQGLMRVEVEF